MGTDDHDTTLSPGKPDKDVATEVAEAKVQPAGKEHEIDSTPSKSKVVGSANPGKLLVEPENPAEAEGGTAMASPGSSGRTTPELDSNSLATSISAQADGRVLTESMILEEKRLHQEGKEAQKKLERETKEKFETELADQRYKRLQHLLQKSSIYANFLLNKMEQQHQLEQKKLERQKKKKEQEEAAKKSQDKKSSSKEENSSQESLSSESDDQVNVKTRSRRTKAKVKNNSQENIIPEKTQKKKGSKRKVGETYALEDYLDKETLAAKKQKSDKETVTSQDEDCKPAETVDQKPTDKDARSGEEELPDTFSRIINGEAASDKQPDLFSGGVLRPYQIEGMEWLKVLYENGVNGILADEMGLGKTVQVIALFAHIIKMGVPGPFLICAPLSTLPNWMSEFHRFTPKIPIILYHGTIEERTVLRRKIRHRQGEFQTLPVVITSYEIAMRDRKHMQNYLWKYVVVDEGHRLKNLNCRLVHELKMYKSANRLLLTGTPLQNNLSELWSMLNFLLPEVFDDLRTFESWFDFSSIQKEGGDEEIIAKERGQNIISMLHQILTPFLLRRLKSDVELRIPPKKEIMVYAPLTPIQEEYYKMIVDRTIVDKVKQPQSKILEPVELTPSGRPKRRSQGKVDYSGMVESTGGRRETDEDIVAWAEKFVRSMKSVPMVEKVENKNFEVNIKLINTMMELRKCCNHPYLMEYPLDPNTQQYLIDENIIHRSGKLMVLERLLPALKKQGHKVLIFSLMTKMLDIIQDYCYYKKFNYCRLDGNMNFADRQEQIFSFNNDSDSFLFLISTRAGGLGLNLTAADTVIIYDSDWNPQCDLQAMDRCHRIGQDKPVLVYRLVTEGTIDQRIVERAAAKRKLEKMIIHQGKFKGGKKNLENDFKSLVNPTELLELLRSRDHCGVIQNCKEKVISDKDLKLLLDRSDFAMGKKPINEKAATAKPPTSKVFEIIEVVKEDGNSLM